MKKRTRKLFPLCLLLLAGCPHPSPVQSLYPQLSAALGPGWVLVPLPTADLGPGAVLQVAAADGGNPTQSRQIAITRLGDLKSCGVADAALQVTDSPIPTMVSDSTYQIDASLGINLARITSASLGANASGNADLTITKSTDSSLDYIALSRWLAAPANAAIVRAACQQILAQPNIYLVQEAFIISAGAYSFKDTHGGTIAVTPPPHVPVTASAGGNAGGNGAITIDSPIVFALKVLQPLPQGGFQLAALTATRHHHAAPPPPPPPPAAPLLLDGKSVTSISGVSQ